MKLNSKILAMLEKVQNSGNNGLSLKLFYRCYGNTVPNIYKWTSIILQLKNERFLSFAKDKNKSTIYITKKGELILKELATARWERKDNFQTAISILIPVIIFIALIIRLLILTFFNTNRIF